MSLPILDITDALASHALALGRFEQVNGYEPKQRPGTGITCALWVDAIRPVRSSGLTSTTVRLTYNVRLYSSLVAEPDDAIDPQLVAALDDLMSAYSGDFTLGGLVRHVDLLGAHGTAMEAQAGYLALDKDYRVFTIVLPLVVNDLWDQEA